MDRHWSSPARRSSRTTAGPSTPDLGIGLDELVIARNPGRVAVALLAGPDPRYVVDGDPATAAQVEAALTPGDLVTVTAADPARGVRGTVVVLDRPLLGPVDASSATSYRVWSTAGDERLAHGGVPAADPLEHELTTTPLAG